MARYHDGLKVATHIFEAAAWQYSVKPLCRCGHFGLFHPHGLWWYFDKRGWDDHFDRARVRFWCRDCAGRLGRRIRPDRIDAVKEPPQITLPLPDEREWKRAINRFRG